MYIHRIINSVFTSNTYILTSEGQSAFLIDIGDVQPVKELLDNDGKVVKAYPDCIIYTSSFGKEALGSDKLNFSRYHNDPIVWTENNISILGEGDKIEITTGNVLEVLETPGHDKSCLTYKLGNDVFSGDSYIPGVKVIASFPNSHKTDAVKSKERIVRLADGRNLYPGHGDAYIHYNGCIEQGGNG